MAIVAVAVAELLPGAETITLTVPVVTIVPDHVLEVWLLVTVLLLESVNFQLEYVAPDGALLMLQVTLLPRVTDSMVSLASRFALGNDCHGYRVGSDFTFAQVLSWRDFTGDRYCVLAWAM